MPDAEQFTIGASVTCSDGVCGELTRVVVNPVAKELTHLVVAPRRGRVASRLVPLALVDTTDGEIRLRCTVEEFEKLAAAEETQFQPVSAGHAGYEAGQVLDLPYYRLGSHTLGVPEAQRRLGLENVSRPVTHERLPLGEVAVRRGDHVHATDGNVGRVKGLVIDPESHEVTHVLLQEGHLWGRRQVAIPVSAVAGFEDGIHLKISKEGVQALPDVDID